MLCLSHQDHITAKQSNVIPTNTYKPVHINNVGTDLFSLHNSFKLTETKIIEDLEQKPSGERLKELGLTRGEERNWLFSMHGRFKTNKRKKWVYIRMEKEIQHQEEF